MSSTMMMERTGMSVPGMGVPGMGTPVVGGQVTVPTTPNYLMVPRCTYKFETCQGGCKIYCVCDDKTACSMMQNLCSMLTGGVCSCCVYYNGMPVCTYNFTMGMCTCETTEQGVCFTCTSGDTKCCEMIQAYCQCLSTMVKDGCHCCFYMCNTPVCYGCCESSVACKTSTKK